MEAGNDSGIAGGVRLGIRFAGPGVVEDISVVPSEAFADTVLRLVVYCSVAAVVEILVAEIARNSFVVGERVRMASMTVVEC